MKFIPQHSLDFLDSWLIYQHQHGDIPGITIAIAKDDKKIFAKSYGFANIEEKEELTTDHLFRIASHSKTFTATALLQLQEKGKLRIDDKASDYLEWLKEHRDNRWHEVTIRQLLSHSGGVIRDGLDANYWQLKRPFPSAARLKQEILEADLVYDNNKKFKYSNFGYSLLGQIIEGVSGQTYAEYVNKHIIEPLELENTGPEPNARVSKRLASAYGRKLTDKTREHIPDVDTCAMASATGFYSCANDLLTYFSAHMIGTGKLLNDEWKKEMQRVQWQVEHAIAKDEYGLGLEMSKIGERTMIGHGGGFPGHTTMSLFDPKDKLVLTIMTNCLEAPTHAIAKGILSILDYLGEDEPDKSLLKFEGRFANLWGVEQVVIKGKEIVGITPQANEPFSNSDTFEKIDETTLKIVKTNGYMSNGELIHYIFDNDDKPTKIISAGIESLLSKSGDYHLK